jgi:hypothetical protein
MGLRDHHLSSGAGDLGAQHRDEVAHAGLGHHRTLLLDQPLPDPACGVPLLPRCAQVLGQPPSDRGLVRTQYRRGTHRWLPHRRHRISQRRTHSATVDLVFVRERPDRHVFITGIASDTFELLHSRSHSHPTALVVRLGRRTRKYGEGRSRVGPLQISTTAPSGANSDWSSPAEWCTRLILRLGVSVRP